MTAAACGSCSVARPCAGITVHDARNRDVTISTRRGSFRSAARSPKSSTRSVSRTGWPASTPRASIRPRRATSRMSATCGSYRPKACSGSIPLWCSPCRARPEGSHGPARSGQGAAGAGARNLFRTGPARQDQMVGHAMGADKRAECLTAVVTDGATAVAARQSDEAGPRDVRDVMLNGRAMAAARRPLPTRSSRLPAASTRSTAMTATRSSTTKRSSRRSRTWCCRSSAARIRWMRSSRPSAFALTPVVANKTFISMEGLYLLGFGRARRRRPATSRSSSIRRWRRRPRNSRPRR